MSDSITDGAPIAGPGGCAATAKPCCQFGDATVPRKRVAVKGQVAGAESGRAEVAARPGSR